MTAHYTIGASFPLERHRGIMGRPCAPAWYAFLTAPQAERNARAWMEKGGAEVWFPTEQAFRTMPRAKIKRQPYERLVVPGYIFARFDREPQWDILKGSRYLIGVVGLGERPAPLTDEAMAAMAHVPKRLEAIREKARLAKQITPGSKARIRDGAMRGWIVDVSSVHEGVASFIVPLLGERVVTLDVERMDKISDQQ